MASLTARITAVILAWAAVVIYSHQGNAGTGRGTPLCDGCNVILISVDTVRADHLSCYGYERPTSPNIDRFASKSIVFENAISQAPWTLPAHGSMFTGLYPGRLGVVHYPALRRLPDQPTTLAEVFRKNGYQTGGFSGGGFVSGHYGFARGFDTYSTNGRRFEHNMHQALDWMEQNKERPFFMFLHGYNAHRPYFSAPVDKRAVGLPDGLEAEKIRFCLKNDRDRPPDDELEQIISYYDAAIHHGDRQLGAFFKALRQTKLDEKTVVLLTSDHGEEFFEHGNCDHVRFTYRESLHVPYIVYVPKLTPNGRKQAGLIPASISVARTLLDLVGVDHTMPGASLLPIIEGREYDFPLVYSEADSPAGNLGSRGANIAVTARDKKLIQFSDEGTDEAFDLAADLAEQKILPEGHDAYYMRQTLRSWDAAMVQLPKPTTTYPRDEGAAAARRAARQKARARRAAMERAASGDPPAPEGPEVPEAPEEETPLEVPPEIEESLKALGYIE